MFKRVSLISENINWFPTFYYEKFQAHRKFETIFTMNICMFSTWILSIMGYLLYHMSIHPSIYQSFFFMHFTVNCRHLYIKIYTIFFLEKSQKFSYKQTKDSCGSIILLIVCMNAYSYFSTQNENVSSFSVKWN